MDNPIMPTILMPNSFARSLAITLLALALSTSANADDHDKSCYDPQILDSNDQFTNPTFLKINNGLAYIIDNNQSDLVVVDLQALGFPTLSRTSEFNSLNNITFNGNTAYLSFGSPNTLSDQHFAVWDIEDPADPWFIRPYDTSSSSTRLLVKDDTLFHSAGLALNVARQRAPRIEQSIFPNLPGTILHTINNTAYTNRLATLDITDTANIIELTPPLFGMFADQIISQSNTIFARSDSLITIYDHSTPTNLIETNTIDLPGVTDFVLRTFILFATTPEGIQVFDVSNPNSPFQIATYPVQFGLVSPTQIELVGNTFYTLDSLNNLASFNFTTNPIATHATTDIAYEIKLAGPLNNLALLATDAGMDIFDISNPQLPTLLSTFPTNNTAVGIDAVGSIAYIATHQAGLDIVDISDPSNPTLITNFDSGRSAQDVQIIDNLAYVVDRIDGLNILDITDPSNPQLISITNTPGWASDITIYQNGDQRLAIMPHERFDLQILDVTNPSTPTIISTITPLVPTTNQGIRSATVRDNLLYTSERSAGYRVFEFSNPSFPVELTTINTDLPSGVSGFGNHIAIQGSRLYLANSSGGFSTYDNTDPLNPNLILNHPANDAASFNSAYMKIELHDNLAYAAVSSGGFRIIDPLGCFVPCTPDFNNDGSLNFFDISTFITAFESREPASDINADGRWNFFDISTFLTLFAQGCP
jgi:hypothetical protein